ncbi:hypothetical protein BU24DRAFT_341661 [Aaosphaeria arxii CBS 175.79]|uniref:MYND-type domain-containing protein n=1 Tax=Aaosphaeria arxii CBS 175.79 TaxID=1450172 RepID=A0A6A5Y4T8_9PLEO|nr:uncharacterized protein BU24DRAFT_341661 [Aaosphaeria arxii CBS 175.79]KAF2019810.1 hypothetical protein BU24DRAFT_341661 [Aaosphaeria arxii CBS 175.79]
MDELCLLQQEISDLTNILSFITETAIDLDGQVNSLHISEPPRSGSRELDPEKEDLDMDEAELEVLVAGGGAEIDAIKRNTLDRLAEVLARFKTAKGTRVQKKRNRDAKHVASVIMVEDTEAKAVKFLCSKNEGLDTVDMHFLKKLEELLQNIILNGKRTLFLPWTKTVFDKIFDHLQSRVKYYSAIICEVIKEAKEIIELPKMLTGQNLQRELLRVTSREWQDNHGLHFKFLPGGIGEEVVSDKAVDCFSDLEEETLVQEVYSEFQHVFGNGVDQVLPIPTKNLLKKVYRIVRHPRQRPALKGLLRQAFHDDNRLFKKAWDSLLYLTRMFFAAVTFVDFATKLNFTCIRFQQVPTVVACRPQSSDSRSPTEVLESLGHCFLTQNWRDFFQIPKKIADFIERSRSKRTVHAEVQLILYTEDLLHAHESRTSKVFPYIGCSRKCCFFCELFRIGHGTFQARGTHLTLFPLWALPRTFPLQSLQVLRQFSILLRDNLRGILNIPYPPPHRDLLQQSSAALSTAQAIQREAQIFSIRSQTMTRMMLGPGGVSASEHQIEFLPSLEEPGYAILMGGSQRRGVASVPIEEAETSKTNHERSTFALEKMGEMPPTECLSRKVCRHCRKIATYKCSACWTYYCSKTCQRRHWMHHVFTCRVPSRPNDADFLKWAIRIATRDMNAQNQEGLNKAMLYLLADDHVCSSFGFNNCETAREVLHLACLYGAMLSKIVQAVSVLREHLEAGSLYKFMEQFCQLERHHAQTTNSDECSCVTWFLDRSSPESFIIPNRDKTTYDIWVIAMTDTIESLGLRHRVENGYKLSESQVDVFRLYLAIQPNIGLIPDICSSSWLKFGFCYCKSFSERAELARQYLLLGSSSATFDDIVSAYETSSLAGLMRTKGIDISELEIQGVRFHRPPPCEYSVYRLMIGVEHALSGRFCSCFRVHVGRDCHAYYETHMDRESDTNFGFHLTSSWERWQLLNFYKHLFHLPGFDPRCMAEATEDLDPGKLETYLNTLVPDMRRKISDRNRANIMFPRLRNRLGGNTPDRQNISHFHLPCNCKEHDVIGPSGISHLRAYASEGSGEVSGFQS